MFAKLQELRKGLTRDATISVAFAGHGLQFGKESPAYICAVEAENTDKASFVDLDEVVAMLHDSAAGVCLMAVDACRDDPKTGWGHRRRGAGPKNGAVFSSRSKGQFARESPKLRHEVFFHFFIEALKDPKLADEAGEVMGSRVQEFVAKKVEKYVREEIDEGARQEPHEITDITGRSPVLVKLTSLPVARPSPKLADGEVAEPFDWKGEKRTRRVLMLDLGGEKMKTVRVRAGAFNVGSHEPTRSRFAR